MVKRINLKSANVARSSTIRDIDRQIILNYIREKRPDFADGNRPLYRIAALDHLAHRRRIEKHRADEEIEGESSGGRPPQLLSLRTAHAVGVGVDLGKRRTIFAASDLAGRILEQERYVKSLKKQTGAARISFAELINLAVEGDKKALTALKETAFYIGVGIANLFQGLSPEVAIVTGTIVRAGSLVVEDIMAGAESATCQDYPKVKIISSMLGGAYPTLMGAISLVLIDKFASVSGEIVERNITAEARRFLCVSPRNLRASAVKKLLCPKFL